MSENKDDLIQKDVLVQNDDLVEQEIIKRAGAAEKLLSDSDKTERFLERLEQKLNKVPVVG